MPKKPYRNNPPERDLRTVQSAASLLRRISQKAGGALPAPGRVAAVSLIERLRLLLPEALRPHLIEVLEKPGELVLFTDSAAWAGRLKLAAPEISTLTEGRRQVVRVMPREGYRK